MTFVFIAGLAIGAVLGLWVAVMLRTKDQGYR